MNYTVAIHEKGGHFSERWIEYCRERHIPHKVVDCCDSRILTDLRGTQVLLWHWSHQNPKEMRVARDVIRAAELMGISVFPSTDTCWSFDNKIAQKYQLEAVGAPLVPTYVFYKKNAALEWLSQTTFPKVFKLARGAGSRNVHLVRDANQGSALVRQAFGRGFKAVSSGALDVYQKLRQGRTAQLDLYGKLLRFPASLLAMRHINRLIGREKGYVCFQDFIPNNQFDTRITVIGRRAFGFIRRVRQNDFRASGSGNIDYDRNLVNPLCIQIAFEVSRKLRSQSTAFDMVIDPSGQPLIVEISYCFLAKAVYDVGGYWDESLTFHEGACWPQDAILEDLLNQWKEKSSD